MKELKALATIIMTSGQEVTTSIMESVRDIKSVDTPWADQIINIVVLFGCIAVAALLPVLLFIILSKGVGRVPMWGVVPSKRMARNISWKGVVCAVALVILSGYFLYWVGHITIFG